MGKKSRHSIGLPGATRLTPSDFILNLLLLKGQRYVKKYVFKISNIKRDVFTFLMLEDKIKTVDQKLTKSFLEDRGKF